MEMGMLKAMKMDMQISHKKARVQVNCLEIYAARRLPCLVQRRCDLELHGRTRMGNNNLGICKRCRESTVVVARVITRPKTLLPNIYAINPHNAILLVPAAREHVSAEWQRFRHVMEVD